MIVRITHLTALGNDEGTDKIVGQIDGHVDLRKLADAKLLNEYTDEFGGVTCHFPGMMKSPLEPRSFGWLAPMADMVIAPLPQ